MSGRISDVEAIPLPSRTIYVAASAGGIWKSTNGGVTFRPIFDNERVISMGDIAIAPSDTNVVYAGTGEPNSRNSISPGGGIYKTTDGGKSWSFLGLKETETVGRIVVHPRDPNTVYVAALGAIWRSNPQRGLYKTTDGGKTWQLSKFVSDKAGFVDVVMDPTNPDILYAASWERVRGPYFLRSGGPGSALWKTTDAGKTWTEIRGGGFPETMKGRIGLAIAPSNAQVIYAMVEADTAPNTRKGGTPARRPSGLYRSADGGKTWEKTNDANVRPFYYSQVRVDTKNPDRVYFTSTPVLFSDSGGRGARAATQGLHVDHHAMWIDPNDPNYLIVGNDGGIGISYDRGGNYDFPNTMPLGQFYQVSYDMAIPYRVCGGLQDNGSWCGPSRRRRGAITNAHWVNVGGGDGFFTQQDPTDPNIIYVESQGGNMSRLNFLTGERTQLTRPSWRPRYRQFEDSIIIARGDTTQPAPANVNRRLAELRARASSDSAMFDLRWNWNTPFFLSPHSPTTFYAAANRVLKSTNRGEGLYPISPDLSTQDTMKIRISTRATGGITPDNTGAEAHATITALAESPVRPGLLYAGTDDGNVWLTRNDGGTWENLTGRFPGLPRNAWTRRIEPSHFDTSTFYIAFSNHQVGDFKPYVYVSTDYGRTFRSIASNLPSDGPDFVHVIREDPHNRDLLFVGTDVGVYASLDRGTSWQKFMANLPTVPVHDLQIHPRDHELIAGTHGRSIWIVDIAPLEQMTGEVLKAGTHLFKPRVAYQYPEAVSGGGNSGHQVFQAFSPSYGAEITYRVAEGSRGPARIVITDVSGDTVRTLNGPGTPGIQRVSWDFNARPAVRALSPADRRDSARVMARFAVVADSMEKEGTPRATLERLRDQLVSGGGGFGGGGGGGGGFGGGGGGFAAQQRGDFNERPGEAPPPRARAARGPGGGAPAGGQARRDTTAARAGAVRPTPAAGAAPAPSGEETAEDPGTAGEFGLQQLVALLRPALPGAPQGGGGFGAFAGIFGRGPAPTVSTGDYLVTLTVGGKTMKQVLRVERIGYPDQPAIAGPDTSEP